MDSNDWEYLDGRVVDGPIDASVIEYDYAAFDDELENLQHVQLQPENPKDTDILYEEMAPRMGSTVKEKPLDETPYENDCDAINEEPDLNIKDFPSNLAENINGRNGYDNRNLVQMEIVGQFTSSDINNEGALHDEMETRIEVKDVQPNMHSLVEPGNHLQNNFLNTTDIVGYDRPRNSAEESTSSDASSDDRPGQDAEIGTVVAKDSDPSKRKRYPCDRCPKAFLSRRALNGHIVSVHEGVTYNPGSLHCGKGFASRANHYRQVEDTHGVVRFPCDKCGKLFKTKRSRDDHAFRQHSGQRSLNFEVWPQRPHPRVPGMARPRNLMNV